jgi:hypothetical protein
MTSKEINLMPPLEMGRTTYQWTIGASRHFNEPKPKSFSKTLIRVESKSQVDFESLEVGGKGTTKQKGKPFNKTSKKNTKSHLNVL